MSAVCACVLCIRQQAAPGWYACHGCSDRLVATLDDIRRMYADIDDVDELAPSGTAERGSPGYGSRSPASDGILVHTDVRSKWDTQGPPALATIESWARLVREEIAGTLPPSQVRATVPAGRVSMAREAREIVSHWPYIMAQPWLDEFAGEMRAVRTRLRGIAQQSARSVPIGPCPVVPASTGQRCGAMLRARLDSDVIRCHSCGSAWRRSQWDMLSRIQQQEAS